MARCPDETLKRTRINFYLLHGSKDIKFNDGSSCGALVKSFESTASLDAKWTTTYSGALVRQNKKGAFKTSSGYA